MRFGCRKGAEGMRRDLNRANRYKIIGIIPARGGSKGIPHKNRILVNKKPLIVYTIEAAQRSRFLDQVVVSSDDEKILQIARRTGVVALKRPKRLAGDEISSEAVIAHVLEQLKARGEEYRFFVLLQPTSPLRDQDDIDAAMKMFLKKNAKALISVFIPAHSPFKAFVCDGSGFLRGIVDQKMPFMRRQDLPVAYFPNGAIYINGVKDFMKDRCFSVTRVVPFMMPLDKSIDVDTMTDVAQVHKILRLRKGFDR